MIENKASNSNMPSLRIKVGLWDQNTGCVCLCVQQLQLLKQISDFHGPCYERQVTEDQPKRRNI
jgi:hypothetical protein